MNKVEPIRSLKKIKAMKDLLRGNDKTGRNQMIFLLGIHSVLRISDILNLKYDDLFHENYRFREYIRTKEAKTKKWQQFRPPDSLKNQLKSYAKRNKIRKGDFIFPSKRTHSNHLDRTYCWRILSQAAATVGIPNFGTHSLRKAFGYHYYKKTKDIATLMKIFNHGSQKITLRYIGINQETLDKVYTDIGEIYNL